MVALNSASLQPLQDVMLFFYLVSWPGGGESNSRDFCLDFPTMIALIPGLRTQC